MAESRRLAAIMFTDTVGYTASTQADEARTLELLHQQEELLRPLLAAHQGHEVKSTGDGFLVEFDSALRATQCAVEIQRHLHERNAEAGRDAIRIRIGIHLGDVVQRGADILGDAVNIAARIEPVAEPGGICVSGAVREQVWNKISDRLEKLPPHALKGLQVSVDVYQVVLPWNAGSSPTRSPSANRLAVLPFSNISPDPRDEYVADGLTEEMITVLSQLQGLRVIARTSVLPYKTTPKPVSQIGAELDVASVLEGSVRRAGGRIRVTVQLIDVGTQEHTWAKTYERELDDVFALQDDIAKEVAEALKVNLGSSEEARLGARPTPKAESYLAYLRGRALLHERTADALAQAKQQFESAIALDPTNAAAYSGLADATYLELELPIDWPDRLRPREDPFEVRRQVIKTGQELVQKALALDPDLAEAHASNGYLFFARDRLDDAERELQRAISLSPSYAAAHTWYADVLFHLWRIEEALEQLRQAEEADPLSAPLQVNTAIYMIGLVPGAALAKGYLGIYYALMGRDDKARELLAEVDSLPNDLHGKALVISVMYAYLHDSDHCFPWMERALARRETLPDWWKNAPRLEHIRVDPRFAEMLKREEPP